MQKRCEEKKRDDEALQLCMPRKAQPAPPPPTRQTFAQVTSPPVREISTPRCSAFDKGRVSKFLDGLWENTVKRTRDGAVVYTHPLVTSTFHVQNSKFSLYSQNMLQNIIPQKMLQNTLTDHSITSPRGVIAPLEVMRHFNSVQALNAHACAVQTTDSFTAQPHDGARTLQINSWRGMHTVSLGIKDCTIRVPTAVCRFPPAFQRDNSFSGAGKIKACSSGSNFLC